MFSFGPTNSFMRVNLIVLGPRRLIEKKLKIHFFLPKKGLVDDAVWIEFQFVSGPGPTFSHGGPKLLCCFSWT